MGEWCVFQKKADNTERVALRVRRKDDKEAFRVAVSAAKKAGNAGQFTVDRYPPIRGSAEGYEEATLNEG